MTALCAASGALAMAASAWTSVASAAPAASGWQVAYRHGTSQMYTKYTSVAVSGSHVWAVGMVGVAADGLPAGAHLQNGRWAVTAMSSSSCRALDAVSADAPGDAWATGVGCVLHWQAGKWAVARKWAIAPPPAPPMTDIIAFSPTNVWTFGDGWTAQPGLGTWHLQGRTWKRITGLGANITTASAVSATSIWAIGGVKAEADAILHYANGSWHQATSTALTGLRFDGIVAAGANSLWVTATTTAKPVGYQLLHLANGRWTSYNVPDPFSSILYFRDGQIAPDGRGGVWITDGAQLSSGRLLHFSRSGQWSAPVIAGGNIMQIVRVPGTTTLWASGATVWDGHFSAGTLWRHG
ncbi:MAG TPA: hypothetical protein VF834_24785 [Streptosporangiaceae bacterium]